MCFCTNVLHFPQHINPTVLYCALKSLLWWQVDSLLGQRGSSSEHEAMREIKNEFMSNWEGIRSTSAAPRVMVLGATNRPHDLDEAVLRRFTKRIFCDLPDRSDRSEIMKVQIIANSRRWVSMECLATNCVCSLRTLFFTDIIHQVNPMSMVAC